MDKRPCEVAIVSPAGVVVAGLTAMLADYADRVRVVELAGVGFDSEDPDVILFDAASLQDGDERELAHLVKETTSAVLVVDQEMRPDLGARALAIGADGFFSISVGAAELVAAVESTTTGWEPGDPGANPTVGSGEFEQRGARLGHDVGLTPREIDILTLITQGLSNQEIAERTFLSINSVKTYIRSAYRRIDVSTRSQAVVWCVQHGFAPPPES